MVSVRYGSRPRFAALPLAGFFLAVACACRAGAETLFFEAETMTTGTAWVVDNGGWQTGSASGGWMLWGSAGGQGASSNTVQVSASTTYRVWVRYVDILAYRGPFKMQVFQNGAEVAFRDFDLESLRLTPEGKAIWGSDYGNWVWSYVDAPLVPGSVDIVMTKVAPITASWVTRRLDCVVLSTDLTYTPGITDFVAPLYVRVTMGSTHPTACVIHLWGRRPRSPWYLPHYNLWEDKALAQCYTGIKAASPPANALTAGDSTPWFNLAPLLDPVGENQVQFYAMQEYNTGLAASDFTVAISSTPSGDGLIDTFSRRGQGSGIMLLIDLMDRNGTQSDLDYSTAAHAAAASLAPAPGRRPRRFPMSTSCGTDSGFYRPATVSNEVAILSALGMSSLRLTGAPYQPVYYAAGFPNIEWATGFFNLTTGGDYSAPKTDSIASTMAASAQAALDSGHADDIVSWWLMDEPGSMSMSHIAGCAVCAAKYRNFLEHEGLAPAFFGKSDWSQVSPTATTNDTKAYYYTAVFRCQILADMFRLGTAGIQAKIPDAPTSANFAEESTYNGNLLYRGVDWFAIFEQEALRLGWTEDWLAYVATYQLCGFRADQLRAACSRAGREFRMYNIIRQPWDIQAKAVAEIGHGARAIYHYTYGPYYTGTSDSKSLNTDLYPALRAVNYAVGGAEDRLAGATVVKSKIALLYSHATDLWTLEQTYSTFGKDRMGLYLILRHLGYPIDFVTEKDIAAGGLADYAMLICDGSHLHSDALLPLVSWLNGGGVLYVGAGSLMRNQFNQALGFDSLVGLTRAPFVFAADPGREYYELPTRPNLAAVNWSGVPLESVCGYQKVSTNGTEQVLATFAGDGSPAVFIRPVGAGKLEYAGFLPGLAYQKTAVVTMKARNTLLASKGLETVTYSSTDFAEGYRTLFSSLLAPITPGYAPPVQTGHYLVEANRLDGTNGTVVALSNWTGAPVNDLCVSFRRNGSMGNPQTVVHPIKSVSDVGGVVTVVFDMVGPCDFILLPQERDGPIPRKGTCLILANLGEAVRPGAWGFAWARR
jgi:hypothetical protein